jgi:hypothetical protein
MRTLTVAAALVAALPIATVADPALNPSLRFDSAEPPAADRTGVLVAGGMGGHGMGGGGVRPGGGMGGGGGGMGGGGGGSGGMGSGGGGTGGGGMGSSGMGGFGGMGQSIWRRPPTATPTEFDSPECSRTAAQSKKAKKSKKEGRVAPECDLDY